MNEIIISMLVVFFGRILHDLVFNLKIELFNRGNKVAVAGINFIESIVGISVIATVVSYLGNSPLLLIIFGAGSSIGGLLVLALRDRFNRKLIGQRQYYVRVAFTGNEDLLDLCKQEDFSLSVQEQRFTDGVTRTVIEGSMENREQKERFKSLLRGRSNKIVTIVPAREVIGINKVI